MKIRYYSGLAITILFLFFLSGSCAADPAVMISDYELTPSVFMPGDEGILSLTVTNGESTSTTTTTSTDVIGSDTESTSTTDVNGVFLTKIWMIKAYDNDREIKASTYYSDVGYLSAAKSVLIDFKVTVDENFTEGVYFPKIKINPSGYDVINYPIKFRISNKTVDLISKDVPSQVSQSGSTDITLSVVNNRENSVDGIHVYADQIEGIDLVPSSIFIGSLESDTSEDVTFSIVPKKIGKYNLSFKVDFKNGNNLHNSTIKIPIEVVSNYDVAPVLYSFPDFLTKGKSADVRVEVYNAKTEEITGVIVKPLTNITISPSEYFIGSMDPDDVFSASFDIDCNNLKIGENYTVDFKVSFKQGDNYYETDSISSTFFVTEPIEQQNNNLGLLLMSLFILIIIIYIVYRFFKKRRLK